MVKVRMEPARVLYYQYGSWDIGKIRKFFKFSLGPKSEKFLGRKSYLGMEGKISYHDHNFSRVFISEGKK